MEVTLKRTRRIRETPLPAWPYFCPDAVQAVSQVLESGRVNQWTGQEVRGFEQEFAEYLGVEHCIAVMNGTVSLELALRALGVGPGDEVVVAPRSFVASVSCVVAVGATPVFADVEPGSGNLTAETIEAVTTARTKAVIPVHVAGLPCDMDPIMELAERLELWVIEDCAQAHGAEYKGRMVGSIGHVGSFSFCQDKIFTTGGEGGLISTRNEAVWRRAWAYKDHGKSYHTVFETEHPPGFRWLHESFGSNWRMTEMQAAIGRVFLRKLPEWLNVRARNADIVEETLARYPEFEVCAVPDDVRHAYYKFYWTVRQDALPPGWDRDRIAREVAELGVPCTSGTCCEIYKEKTFDDTGFRPREPLPVTKALGEDSLMFLVHPTLTVGDMHDMCSALEAVMESVQREAVALQ